MINFSIIQKSQLEGASRIDAEYYQPEYLQYSDSLNKLGLENLNNLTSKIDVGFVSSMTSHFQEEGIPLLRTQNVHEFFADVENDVVYIDEEFHKKLKKSQIFPGYLLIARSGSIGNVSIVTDDFQVANSADIILIKVKSDKIVPEFLAAFLNSKYGKFQIERGSSGGLQGHINLFSLEKLNIPLFNFNIQGKIRSLVLQGLSTVKESKDLYLQAENLLLEKMGLKNVVFEDKISSIVNYSDVIVNNRIDPEYFQPKYQKLIEKIKGQNARILGELVSMRKGFEPGSEAYEDDGKLFIRVSSISKLGIEEKDQKYLSEELYQKMKKDYEPKLGDILLTKDATPGIAYVIKDPIEGIISGGILDLKVKENIESEYLALCISSIVGQWQAQRDAGGSIIAHWKPEQVRNMVIPVLPAEIQKQIADLVVKSHEARKKSKELLEQAKREVEEIIDSASSLRVERGGDN